VAQFFKITNIDLLSEIVFPVIGASTGVLIFRTSILKADLQCRNRGTRCSDRLRTKMISSHESSVCCKGIRVDRFRIAKVVSNREEFERLRMVAFLSDVVTPVSSAASAVAIKTNYGELAVEYRSTDLGVSVILKALTSARESSLMRCSSLRAGRA
jgi:hypothetical protein